VRTKQTLGCAILMAWVAAVLGASRPAGADFGFQISDFRWAVRAAVVAGDAAGTDSQPAAPAAGAAPGAAGTQTQADSTEADAAKPAGAKEETAPDAGGARSRAKDTDAPDAEAAAGLTDADLEQAGRLWHRMRHVVPGSGPHDEARAELKALIERTAAGDRCRLAAALMDRQAPQETNAAALALFGPDALPADDVARLLADERRGWAARTLLKTYYQFLAGPGAPDALSAEMRRALLERLAARLEGLASARPGYGEQRLVAHLCSSTLQFCARRDARGPAVRRFVESLEAYAQAAPRGQPLGEAVRGWLALRRQDEAPVGDVSTALVALGHWDAVTRWKAARLLGQRAQKDPDALQQAWALLDDPRDEVRAAAARVFVFAAPVRAGLVVPRVVRILRQDRGVVVQAAAAEVIGTYAQQAAGAVEPLLAALEQGRPGRKRTSSLLRALAHLAPHAEREQLLRIRDAATKHLGRAPDGALAALQVLGPVARASVGEVLAFRESADRLLRRHIDEHVLPAITGRTAPDD